MLPVFIYSQSNAFPQNPNIRKGKLENGLTYYLMYNNKPEHRAELRMALKAGSICEDEDQQGLAHFVEHMCFNGSKNFKKNELVDYLESTGTKFGPDLNAYTSFDETVYMLQVRTDIQEHFDKGLLVLRDWANDVSFDHQEIDKERGVVLSEWRSGLGADERMQHQYLPIMYYQSHYANRLPIGLPEIIEKSPYDATKRFYKDWYRPDLMAIAVVGDINLDAVEGQIRKMFSDFQAPVPARPRKEYEVPMHKETFIKICSDKEATETTVSIMYKHPQKPYNNLDDYKRNLIYSLYSDMLGQRLNEISKNPDPPFVYAYSGYSNDVHSLDTYTSYAVSNDNGAQKALEVLLRENKRVMHFGFTETEFARTKENLLRRRERNVQEKDKTESRSWVSKIVYEFLEGYHVFTPEQEYEYSKTWLPQITLADVNALGKEWIRDQSRVIVVTSPDKKEIQLPLETDIEKILTQVNSETITAYVDKVDDTPLFSKKLSPKPILQEKYDPVTDVNEWQFENGVKIVHKQTNFKNDEIVLNSYSAGGTSLCSDDQFNSARFALGIINESGISKFDVITLQKKLTGKIVRVNPYITELFEGLNGSCSPKDAETMMQLVYLYGTDPRMDASAFASFQKKQSMIYKNQDADPEYRFYRTLSKLKFNNHIRRLPPTEQMIESIHLDQVYAFYKDRFSDFSDFTFFIVGNISKEDAQKLTSKYLANLPSTHRKEQWKDVNAKLITKHVQTQLNAGEAQKSYVDITLHGSFKSNPEAKLIFNAMVDALRIKLRESLREDKGGVYGVRCSGNVSDFPRKEYSINISFNADPPRVTELRAAAFEVIQSFIKDGVSEKDVNKVKETMLQDRVKSLKENNFWTYALSNSYQLNESTHAILLEAFKKNLEKVNIQSLKKATTKYLKTKNIIESTQNPATQSKDRS